MEKMSVNQRNFTVGKLLGKGKGGYSYLVRDEEGMQYVLKQIHHEPCSYYQFGNKLEAEKNDYRRLKEAGIRIPLLYDVDEAEERILKEYIDGPTIEELAGAGRILETYRDQVKEMCRILYARNLNIDYYPTNFIVQKELLYYIDYECNTYSNEWNFENWGKQYWQ